MYQHRYQCAECAIVNFYRRTRLTSSGCLEWTGGRSAEGYGRIKVDTRYRQAHRHIWELIKGPIPAGMIVCHRCDNPACVDVGHLFLGTDATNSDDKVRKNRHARGRTIAVLTEDQVILIKQRIADGDLLSAIARDYNVTPGTISAIKCERSWRHVTI